MISVCSFEAELGYVLQRTQVFAHGSICACIHREGYAENEHHCKAYFVKLCFNNQVLEHLNVNVAEAVYEIQHKEGIDSRFLL